MSKKPIKKNRKTQINLEKTVMSKIIQGDINMKPRWYFIFGSILTLLGLLAAGISTIFLINLIFFSLRQHGPMGDWRLQLMIESFPWWILLLAIGGIISGIYLLKQYDFAYKKNFYLIAGAFIVAIILAAFLIDLTGINNLWFRKGPLRRFYHKYQPVDSQALPPPTHKGRMQNKSNNFTF